jgi:hypothetical protein
MRLWQKIGILLSVIWMIGIPIYVMIDSNRRANEFYGMCRRLESSIVSDPTNAEQQHESCWRSAKFMTPSGLAQTLIAGNADTLTLWFFILGPLVMFWIAGGLVLATLRWVRRPPNGA